MKNLREFILALRRENEIIDINVPVDPSLEIAEIHRRIAKEGGPALFFHKVKGSPFPLVTNLFGSKKRVELAFPKDPKRWVDKLVTLFTQNPPLSLKALWQNRKTLSPLNHMGTRSCRSAPVMKERMEVDLEALPLLKLWPRDGGHFLTLPLVYTEPPNGGAPNLGIYRLQRFDKTTTGIHWQIGKGGGFHYKQAEDSDQPLPVTVMLGGPPALMVSAIAPLPKNVPELMLAGLLQGEKLAATKDTPCTECEFVLKGHVPPHIRQDEGPFGDHYGYYSEMHPFPIFECKEIFHRKDAIYPATVVGKPKQEDYYIGNFLQELLSPLFPVVMPAVRALWSYGEAGFHTLAAALLHERYERESLTAAMRILGEGQLSLTKFLIATDQPVNLQNFEEVLTTVLERFQPEKDLYIFSNTPLDTLDYSGPKLNIGSKGVLLGIGEKVRDLPETFRGCMPSSATDVKAFCPGSLLVQMPQNEPVDNLPSHEDFSKWPLVIVVDDIGKATADFLWTVFTRFEPAADIYAKHDVKRHHLAYSGPIVIDARMKPSYPEEVTCDKGTEALVSKRWKEYF